MKKRISLLLLISLSILQMYAQNDSLSRMSIHLTTCNKQKVSTEPIFPSDIYDIVMGNMSWPVRMKTKIDTVLCKFTINKSGYVEQARVIKSKEPRLRNEALSIIYGFPYIIPAQKKGKNKAFNYKLMIVFNREKYDQYKEEQKKRKEEEKNLFIEYDAYPEFPGGMRMLMAFLNEKIRYPKVDTQARVVCQMVVEKDGSISHIEVIRKVNPILDAEAIRVISIMPKWKPGRMWNYEKKYHEFTPVKYTVPIIFRPE